MDKHLKRILPILVAILSSFTSLAQSDKQRVFTSDIDHFWQAFDSIQSTPDSARQIGIMQSLYVEKGTAGLKAFMKSRRFDAVKLVQAVHKYPRFWECVRPGTTAIKSKQSLIEKYIEKFKVLYPDFREAKIYFTISPARAGGTTKDSLVLIGSEIAVGNSTTNVSEFPDKRLAVFFQSQRGDNIIPFSVHEYVHTQQKVEGKNLLGQSLAEGSCDFITELVIDAKLSHSYLQYGRKHEKELKEQFEKEMYSEDFSNWLYNGATTKTVGDLGYFMGYTICKSYYKNANDKKTALKEIIELNYSDSAMVKAFLAKSGYYKP
ncbi:MAG TPA: hypothetical protein VIT44_18895 [Cyclobacteriaceae bacterium]